jgi:PAS domain S-box-containing protein
MKITNRNPMKYIVISNLINCFIVFTSLLVYINEIKLNYFTVISIIIIVLVISTISLVVTFKAKQYISEGENKLEMFEAIMETSPNAIMVHRKLKVIYANNKITELFDLKSSSEIIGRPLEDFMNLNKDAIGTERLESALNEIEFEPLVEEMYFKKSGQRIELQVSSTPVKINNGICVLNLCKNITEKKRITELEKKIEEEERKLREKIELDKLKEEFFSNLSHELRTPLTIILGTVELFERNANAAEYDLEKNYKVLKQNCYRLLKLVNNLLDITKIDSGYFNINIDNHNIISVVEDSVLSVVNYVQNSGLNIIFDTNVEEKIISCDIDSIERIMLNLLSNAIKFTPKGGTIFVNVVDEHDNVIITVKDTGIGIKEEHVDFIFDRFRQVHKSFTRNQKGSGIGLSLVKSLVEMNRGTVSLFSEYGKGSEFTIKLPADSSISTQDIDTTKEKGKFINEKINIELSDIRPKC